MKSSYRPTIFLAVIAVIAGSSASLFGATSITNDLKGFTGTSQDGRPGQAATLASSGLNATYVWPGGAAAYETIVFNTTGANFGSIMPTNIGGNDNSRNYLRTNATDYYLNDFTAYVTVNRTDRQSVFFGMGTANYGSSKSPDIGTGNATVFLDLQQSFDNASTRILGGTAGASTNVEPSFTGMGANVLGLMRLQMIYSAAGKTMTYAVDYAPSGAFVADQTFPVVDLSSISGEWAGGEASSIFFGSQGYVVTGTPDTRVGITFTDFQVTTVPEPSAALLSSLASLALLRRRR